jgi:SAM-dependent methyltransferase
MSFRWLRHGTADPWIEFGDLIRAQLKLQVELSQDRHHRFMVQHGLNDCRHVVDLGTGNGLFLGKIAQLHPEIRFTGIDEKADMISEAGSRNEANIRWIRADVMSDSVMNLLQTADGILMRYFVLHLPNTAGSLRHILNSSRPGVQLWIFDLDTEYSVCRPEHPAFTRFQRLVTEFCRKHSVDIRLTAKVPPILKTVGVQTSEVLPEPFNNQVIDPARFAEYLYREAVLYHHFLHGTHHSAVLQQIRKFLFQELDPQTRFVQYGMVMIAAGKTATR